MTWVVESGISYGKTYFFSVKTKSVWCDLKNQFVLMKKKLKENWRRRKNVKSKKFTWDCELDKKKDQKRNNVRLRYCKSSVLQVCSMNKKHFRIFLATWKVTLLLVRRDGKKEEILFVPRTSKRKKNNFLCLENEEFKELKWLIYKQLLNLLWNFTNFTMSIYFKEGEYMCAPC